MTIYQVGPGGDFATLTKAAAAVAPGDGVEIQGGTYREMPTFKTPNVTWRAAEGAQVAIDGGWNGKTNTDKYVNLVTIAAEGVKLEGVSIVNSPGRGIAITASRVRVADCRIDNTYHGAILATGADDPKDPLTGIEIVGCTITRTSLSWITEKNPKNVNGCVNIHNVKNGRVMGNVISDGWGEGINLGRGSTGVMVMGNTVHSHNHLLVYFNRCIDCLVSDNTLYHIPDPRYDRGKGTYSAAVVFGDEHGPINSKWPYQSGNVFRGNVVVGTGTLLDVRNNKTGTYDTQLIDTVIADNTFVAGPATEAGIEILDNLRGRPHRNNWFEHNAIEFSNARQGAEMVKGSGAGFSFGHNGWSQEPAAAFRSETDVVAEPGSVAGLGLAKPDAVISRTGEPPETDFSVENYRPLAGSPLVVDGWTIGALSPIPPEPEEPTEPGEPGPQEYTYTTHADTLKPGDLMIMRVVRGETEIASMRVLIPEVHGT